MKRRILLLVIMLGWLASMAWLLRNEAFPEWFARSMAGYRSLLSDGVVVSDQWMRILFNDQHVGYSHTVLDTREGDPAEQFVLSNRTELHLNLMGAQQQVQVTSGASLDALYQLQKFSFALDSDRYSMKLQGQRQRGTRFDVQIVTGANRQRVSIDIPDDVLIYSPMLEMQLKQLEPGRSLRVRMLDPVSLTIQDSVVRSVARETIEIAGELVETTRFEVDYMGMTMQSWMDGQGRMVRQLSPLGWILEAADAQAATAYKPGGALGEDLLAAVAVRSSQTLPAPRDQRFLRLRLRGAPPDFEIPPSERQEALREDDGSWVVRIVQPGWPGQESTSGPEGDVSAHLESTTFIQCDDPAIQRMARSIVRESEGPLAQARALHDWVYRNIEKNPAVSLPSAVDVLRQREGDCNEHTYLYVALARALGIPSKVMVGLVYHEGAFYYHAWPAAYAGGDWIELDPTFGQPVADATHIALLEGEFANQLRLLGLVGKASIEILATEEPADD